MVERVYGIRSFSVDKNNIGTGREIPVLGICNLIGRDSILIILGIITIADPSMAFGIFTPHINRTLSHNLISHYLIDLISTMDECRVSIRG